MEIKIVSVVEEPPVKRGRGGRTRTYPFAQLVMVNSGFKIPFESADKEDRNKIERKVRTAVISFRKTHADFAYKTFTVDENNTEDELKAVEPEGPGIIVKRIATMPERKKRAKKTETQTLTSADVGTVSVGADGQLSL